MRFVVQRYSSVPDIDAEHASNATCSENNSDRSQSPDTETKCNGEKGGMDSVDIPGIITPVARRGRAFAERHTARLVSKVGESNISNQNITGKKGKFVMDLFTTLLDLRWRWCILVFALAFFLSWLGFAVIYYVILIVHEDHLHIDNPDWKPCHTNVYDFTTAFLFSIETQHTIGYGFRSMEPTCPPAVIVLCAQSCIGVFFQCIVTGLIFAKLSRPKRRAETIMFSERAVIIQRDGSLHLLFRVGDMRKTHIIGTSIRAVLVKNRLTKEGEMIPLCQYPLLLQTESSIPGDSFVFLAWPVTVGHHISDQSPLWDVSAEQLLAERFEIVVILEGTVESTGMVTQVRTSYLPSEILWGHRLAPLLTYKKDTGGYKIDHQQFHATIPVNMAECSARELSEREVGADEPKEADYNINFTAPASNYLHRSSLPSVGPFKRLRNSLKKRRNSELPAIHQVAPKKTPPSNLVKDTTAEVAAVEKEAAAAGEAEREAAAAALALKKSRSENGIVHMATNVTPSSDP